MKEICALLLAGSMGAGSVVAVQQAKPAVSQKKAHAPRATRPQARPAVHRRTPAPAAPDCPTIGVGPLPAIALSQLEEGSTLGVEPGTAAAPAFPGTAIALPPIIGPSRSFAAPRGLGGGGFGGGPGGVGGSAGGGGGTTPALPAPGTPPAVPEPEAWAMMISGFGLIGLALRRRPQQAPATA